MKQIKVFIIDHSPTVRKILFQELSKHEDIVVVGRAADPYQAQSKIFRLKPDVILLDIEMPFANGVHFLCDLMRHRAMATIVMTSQTSENSETVLEAMESGAADLIIRPENTDVVNEIDLHLAEKIRTAAHERASHTDLNKGFGYNGNLESQFSEALKDNHHKVIAIGTSTGGTEALKFVLTQMPPQSPGIVAVQHMPSPFTSDFANHLNTVCQIEVREARHGDAVMPGLALIAPGGHHLVLKSRGIRYIVELDNGPPVWFQRPSVDVLFHSMARWVRSNAVSVLLTGMGKDGAEGMLEMRRAGARTVVQDESSSVVFGMPREAILLGAAEKIVSLERIPFTVLKLITSKTK